MMKIFRIQILIAVLMIVCTNFVPAQAQNKIDVKTKSARSSLSNRARSKNSGTLNEGFYFLMNDYKMDHQGEVNILNIKVSYSYVRGIADNQYPDFIPLRKGVEKFLTEYPNETTFWEILNKEVTSMLIEKYPMLASVTCEIQVTPSSKYPFTRGSVVTRYKPELSKTAGKTARSRPSYRRTQQRIAHLSKGVTQNG